MADKKDSDKKSSIFRKALNASEAWLESQIFKSKVEMNSKENLDEEEFYSKAITDDLTYRINSQGYKEKTHRLLDSHLKQMSLKNTIVASIIQTDQNLVAGHAEPVETDSEQGFRIKLKDEKAFLKKIKEELQKEMNDQEGSEEDPNITKAEDLDPNSEKQDNTPANAQSKDRLTDAKGNTDDDVEEYNWELERKAKEKLEEQIADRRKKVQDFILNCGEMENRPFETKKWNFNSFLRAIVRDRLTYDRIATEVIPDGKSDPHHFFPVDASTIKFASPELKNYKTFPAGQTNIDFLYPEKHAKALVEVRDAVVLDDDLLEAEKYKYVQVIRGRIERAYTEDEMKVGMANITTDIYNNGYSVAELELLVGLVSSHMNTEFYNQSYFTQGFSAKGILHIKAPINRRKLETVRQQWHHMLKGSKNSFQTPIFAGVDEVNWIPLTQNHQDIEFSGWMNYLIKMICAVYQIDPQVIGIGMKDEGSKGAGLSSGDNTKEKLDFSKVKGLVPLLKFLANYINVNIIDKIDDDFKLVFVGIDTETKKEALDRQAIESKFKKTLNEIRAEDNLPALPGGDTLILGPEFMQYYMVFSKEAKEKEAAMQDQQQFDSNIDMEVDDGFNSFTDINEMGAEDPQPGDKKPVQKSLRKSKKMHKLIKIEYYKIGDE